MADFDSLTEDYSRQPVPDAQKVGGLRIAAIITGIVITVPEMIVGAEIGFGRGVSGAIEAFILGALALTAMGCLTAVVGAKSNLSTYMIVRFPFGTRGAKFVNAALGISIIGWFVITAAMLGSALVAAVKSVLGFDANLAVATIIGSALLIAAIIFGFKALARLSLVAVPIKFLLIGGMLAYGLSVQDFDQLLALPAGTMTAQNAVSMVIGGYIVGVLVMPDLTRYAKSPGHGILAIVLSLAVAMPCVLLSAAIASAATGERELVTLMSATGFGVFALVLLAFATWTANANNLYATSLVMAAIVPKVTQWKLVVISGVVGTIVALTPARTLLVPFLEVIGILLPPIAGIYVADFFLVRRQRYDMAELGPETRIDPVAMMAWFVAVLVGASAVYGGQSVTTIPSVDAMLAGFLVYAAAGKIRALMTQQVQVEK